MNILQAFVLNGTSHEINILWENEKPYFRASEIGKILQMTNIRATLNGKNFDKDEKTIKKLFQESKFKCKWQKKK